MPIFGSRTADLRPRAYDVACRLAERRGLLEWRRLLVGDVSGHVVELGVGTGRNLRHYPSGAVVTALDIEPAMLGRAVRRGGRAAAQVRLMLADAMRVPLRDGSADCVVVGLTLCSVPDQRRTFAEARRLLPSGGRLRFLEHVRDDDGTARARIQDAVDPVWHRVAGGCHCNRRTADICEQAGFRIERLHRFRIGRSHVAPHVMVEAVRA